MKNRPSKHCGNDGRDSGNAALRIVKPNDAANSFQMQAVLCRLIFRPEHIYPQAAAQRSTLAVRIRRFRYAWCHPATRDHPQKSKDHRSLCQHAGVDDSVDFVLVVFPFALSAIGDSCIHGTSCDVGDIADACVLQLFPLNAASILSLPRSIRSRPANRWLVLLVRSAGAQW